MGNYPTMKWDGESYVNAIPIICEDGFQRAIWSKPITLTLYVGNVNVKKCIRKFVILKS